MSLCTDILLCDLELCNRNPQRGCSLNSQSVLADHLTKVSQTSPPSPSIQDHKEFSETAFILSGFMLNSECPGLHWKPLAAPDNLPKWTRCISTMTNDQLGLLMLLCFLSKNSRAWIPLVCWMDTGLSLWHLRLGPTLIPRHLPKGYLASHP